MPEDRDGEEHQRDSGNNNESTLLLYIHTSGVHGVAVLFIFFISPVPLPPFI